MSEAIIARGGKGIGQQVDLSGINASLLSINTRINQINSDLGSLWDTVNDIGSGALDTATNTIMVENGYYNCTKTGNYWVECVGAGGSGNSYYNSSTRYYLSRGGGSGYINNGTVRLNKGDSVYATVGKSKNGTGESTFFGSYLSANGGQYGYSDSIGIGGNNGESYTGTGLSSTGYIANGGWLYYNSYNSRRVEISGSLRLYFGDGGPGNGSSAYQLGNSGCILITYIN